MLRDEVLSQCPNKHISGIILTLPTTVMFSVGVLSCIPLYFSLMPYADMNSNIKKETKPRRKNVIFIKLKVGGCNSYYLHHINYVDSDFLMLGRAIGISFITD